MVNEAEEFADADKKVKARIDARNKLETYSYNMRTTIADKLGEKLKSEDKTKVRVLRDGLVLCLRGVACSGGCGKFGCVWWREAPC